MTKIGRFKTSAFRPIFGIPKTAALANEYSALQCEDASSSGFCYIKEAQRLLLQRKGEFSPQALDEAICAGCEAEIKKCEEVKALNLGPYEVGKYNKRIRLLTDRLERATERLKLKSYERKRG